jgi:aminopeptidase N
VNEGCTRRCRVRSIMVGLASLAAAAGLVAPGAAQARPCTAGAAGAGDPYFPMAGNGGYNARHYDLDLSYDPGTGVLVGVASIEARAQHRLCSLNLDLAGLEVTSVRVDGKEAASSRAGGELTVTPRRPLERRADFEISVGYQGVPIEFKDPLLGAIPVGFTRTSDGVIVAGQPESAAAWFPVNDHPSDKASYSFAVTVPDGYGVVANGKPRGETAVDGGRTQWRWEARAPMASYLATIDVGQWDVTRWRTDSGIPVYDAVDPAIDSAHRELIDSSLARQGEMLDLLSGAFGPYPFDTVGAIVDPERPIAFALETQTRPVIWSLFWDDLQGNPINADYVVVHELAHQWFGDSVALDRWKNIWLNEGFATYAEWLWLEHEGQATPRQSFEAAYNSYPADDPLWSVVVGDPGTEEFLGDAVYFRGAMTLEALREVIGDKAFWKVIRRWAKRKGGGYGRTGQFIATAERVSGRELGPLFRTWLFTPTRPALPSSMRSAAARGEDQRALSWLHAAQARLQLGGY